MQKNSPAEHLGVFGFKKGKKNGVEIIWGLDGIPILSYFYRNNELIRGQEFFKKKKKGSEINWISEF